MKTFHIEDLRDSAGHRPPTSKRSGGTAGPAPAAGVKSAYIKFAIRKSIDFPIVNCAAVIGNGDARICLNAVYNKPVRALEAENSIRGKKIDEASADAAGAAAVANARAPPGDRNKWKLPIAKAMVKRSILACA